MNNYNALYPLITLYNGLFIKALSKVLPKLLFIKESCKKCITISTKILSSTTVLNIDNKKKCFLSTKSVYYNLWKTMWHWRLE